MQTEIEAKFLDIDADDLRRRLVSLGAELVHSEILMRRQIFDLPGLLLKNKGGWVRVRDEGDKITLSYKQEKDRTLHGTKEIMLQVSDFDISCELLEKIGLIKKGYQENRREKWLLGGCEVTIDTWPWIPTTLEIEGESEELVKTISNKLNLDWSKVLHGSVGIAYRQYFEATDDEIYEYPAITFGPVPEWLEAKRKKRV